MIAINETQTDDRMSVWLETPTPLLDAITSELKHEIEDLIACDDQCLRGIAWHILNEAFSAVEDEAHGRACVHEGN